MYWEAQPCSARRPISAAWAAGLLSPLGETLHTAPLWCESRSRPSPTRQPQPARGEPQPPAQPAQWEPPGAHTVLRRRGGSQRTPRFWALWKAGRGGRGKGGEAQQLLGPSGDRARAARAQSLLGRSIRSGAAMTSPPLAQPPRGRPHLLQRPPPHAHAPDSPHPSPAAGPSGRLSE